MIRYEVVLKNLKKKRLEDTMFVYENELKRIGVKYSKTVDSETGRVIWSGRLFA